MKIRVKVLMYAKGRTFILTGGGDNQYERPHGDVPPTWVAKSASSWYMNNPL